MHNRFLSSCKYLLLVTTAQMTSSAAGVQNLNPAPADMRRALEGLGLTSQAPVGQLAQGVRPQLSGTLGQPQQPQQPQQAQAPGQVSNAPGGQAAQQQAAAAQPSPAGASQQANALLNSAGQLGLTTQAAATGVNQALNTPQQSATLGAPASQIAHQKLLTGIANSLANSASNPNATPDGMTAMTMTNRPKDWHQSVTQDLRNHLVHKL